MEEQLTTSGVYPVQIDDQSIVKSLNNKSGTIELPFLSSVKNFKFKEFSIYGNNKNPFPEIKTYKIYNNENVGLTGRITAGPVGISIIYLTGGQMIRIYNPEPSKTKNIEYVQEIGINPYDKQLHNCQTHDDFSRLEEESSTIDVIPDRKSSQKRNGSTKRIYRAAIMCTGEYFVNNGGGNFNIQNLIISNLNDISAIFEKDIGVEMVMANGSPRLQTDINNDPFDPNGGSRTSQAQSAISAVFNKRNYDVGHVFHNHTTGDGWATGGVARLGAICNDNGKASGWSGSFNNTTNGWIQLAAHEFGHMYNATHTFNGSGDANCTPNISAVSNIEIGSGTTIMSYNGLCDSEQNIPASGVPDNYFHVNSLDRMVSFMENFAECNTDNWIEDNNQEPEATANPCGALYVMPKRTPFMLKGEGFDPDGDNMTYCWEQYDEDGPSSISTIGLIGNAAAANNICPLYRSYPPTPNPVRYIPNLNDIRNNTNSPFEVLTNRKRSIKFRLTVRDNNPNGGAIDWDQIQLNTMNSGPLSVLTPGPGEIVQAGTVMEVTWNTNVRFNEDLCDKAVIKLSTDGGLTFPLILAKDVDYDAGSAMINIPASYPNTEAARIMVACDDYECFAFFDMSNSDFTIESNCFAPANLLCNTEDEVHDFGDPGLNLDLASIQGTSMTSLLGPIGSGSGSMSPAVNDASGSCTRITQIPNNPFLETRFSVTESGTYVFSIDNNINDNVTAYTIFDASTFNPTDACSSFIESNATFINSYTFILNLTAELEACKEYILVSHVTNTTSQNLAITNITGPGQVIRSDNSDDYESTFIAVNVNTDEIIQQSVDADFRLLPVGEYYVVSAYYKAGGAAPPADVDPDNWIGQTVDDLLGSLDCFRMSDNSKQLTVLQSCFVFDIELGNQTSCLPESNTYSQTISFKVDMGPASGSVEINGQSFMLDSDELTVTLTDLVANGNFVDLEFVFSDDEGCNQVFEDIFVSAANCCPIEIDLGGDQIYCQGDTIQLDAGDQSVSYLWFKDDEQLSENGRFLTVSTSGVYSARVEHSSGCINEDEANIQFELLAQITLDKNIVLVCEGDLVVVNAFISNNTGDISWTKDGELLPNTGSSIEVTETGIYEIMVETANSCISTASVSAEFADSPDPDLGPDILNCIGAITTLDAGDEGISFEWRRNAFPISGDESTIDITTFGTYTVIVENLNGCVSIDTINVDYKPLPEFDFGRDVTRCFGNFYTIEAEVSAFEIEWYLNGELIPGENEINYTALENGEYVGQISHNGQCFESDTIEVEYLSVPNVDLPEVISACPGELIELVVDDPNAVFTWSSESMGVLPETSGTLVVATADTYYLSARSTTTFCIIRDTVEVNFINIPSLDLGPDINACDGEVVTIGSPTSGFVAEWFKDGEIIENEIGEEISVTESGLYSMTITSGVACSSEDEIIVSFSVSPTVELGDDISTCPDESVVLDAGDPANSFIWQLDGQDLSESGNTLEVSTSGIYSVTATNSGDCSTSDLIEVSFTELPELNLGDDVKNCEGDIYTIFANAGGFAVEWYYNQELIINNSSDQIIADQSGEYIARVNAGENCSISDTINVEYFPFPVIELGGNQDACPGENIVLELDDMNYNFVWSTESQGILSESSNVLTVTESNTYYVEVSNEANCITRDTVTITFANLPILDLGTELNLCEGEATDLTIISNGFEIEWYRDGNIISGATAENINIQETGNYSVIVSADDNCSVTDEISITFNALPEVNLGEDRAACPGDAVFLDGGDNTNTFTWSSASAGVLSETSNQLAVSESDTFYVEVINEFNCITRDTVSISFAELPSLDLGPDLELCSGEELTLEVESNGFTVDWLFNGEIITSGLQETLSIPESGNYTVRISANEDCSIEDEISITFNALPEVNLGEDRAACLGDAVFLDGGDNTNTFTWSSASAGVLSETSNQLAVSESDTFYVEVINEFNCITRDTVSISFVELPSLNLGPDLELCSGEELTLEVESNGFIVDWLFNGEIIISGLQETLSIPESGNYTVRISANDDCSIEDEIRIDFFDAPEVDLGNDRAACPNELVELIAGDNTNTYAWTSESLGLLGETGNTLSVTESDVYSVVVTNAQNCISFDTVVITFTELPILDLGEDISSLCEGDEFILSADAGGFEIEWQLDGMTIDNESNEELTVTQSGTYLIIASAGQNCSVSDEVEISFNALPEIDELSDQIACSGESVDLFAGADGSFQYIWSDESGVIQESDIGILTVTETGIYTVEAIDANNCSSVKSAEITFIDAPIVELEDELSFCEGTELSIEATSNVTVVEWYVNGAVISGQVQTTLVVTEPGQYIAIVGPGTQCEDRDTITVNEIAAPNIDFLSDTELCADALPYELEISTEANVSIQWALNGQDLSGENQNILTINEEGNYSVLVTSQTGCANTESFEITVERLSSNTLESIPILCEGDVFVMNASSDGESFEWQFNGNTIIGEEGLQLEIKESGDYSFISFNNLGCPTQTDFNINFNTLPIVDLGPNAVNACDGETVLITTDDNANTSFEWFFDGVTISGQNSNELTVTEPGNYSVIATNQFGCNSTDEQNVQFFAIPTISVSSNTSYCEGSSVELSIQTNASDIQWSLNGQALVQNVTSIDASSPGVYDIEVTSGDGCSAAGQITVVENANPQIEIQDVELCPGEMQIISVSSEFDEYIWTGVTATGNELSLTHQPVNDVTTTNASLEVIDANGCRAIDQFQITFNPELNAQVISDKINICEGQTANLEVLGGLFYEWIDPSGTLSAIDIPNPVASPSSSTIYTVNVSDNCPSNFASFDIDVTVNENPNVDAGRDTCTLNNVELQLTATGGVQYIWDNSDLIIGSSNQASILVNLELPAVFNVTAIDQNGCRGVDSVSVCIIEDPLEVLTAVTLITPNGDFINDQLEFKGLDAFPENKLTIFNRWGNVIFKKTGYQNDMVRWDGTRDGQALPADTYYYILEFSSFKIKKSITLLRD